MAINVPALQSIVPGAFLSLGFHEAEPYAANAATYFDSDVKRVIDAGHVWWGEGQPQAAAVMQTNSLALEACRLQMRAGMAATDGLYRALTKAKQELESVLSEIGAAEDGVSYTIDDDGTVKYGSYPTSDAVGSGSSNLVPDPVMSVHHELTYRVQRVLNYANSADITAAGLLERIANSVPAFTENVSPQALGYNEAMVVLSRVNLKLAEKAQQIWEDVSPEHWGDEITSEWQSIFDGLRNGVGADMLTNLPSGTTALEAALRRAGIPLAIGTMLYEVHMSERSENRVPELGEPTDLVPRLAVDDAELQEIIDDLYAIGLADHDHRDRLQDVRERLREWLGDSYDDLAEGVEPTTHTELVPLGGSNLAPTRVQDPHTPEYYDPDEFAISPEDRKTARQLYSQLSTILAGGRRQHARD